MTKNIRIAVGFLVLAAVAFFWFGQKERANVVRADMHVPGDYEVKSGERTVLEGGAKITVGGNLALKGALDCAKGPVELAVAGNAVIEGAVTCVRPDEIGEGDPGAGITMVVGGTVTIAKDATIASNGHVQIVSEEGQILKTEGDIDAAYAEAAENKSSGGPRIGPFAEDAEGGVSANLRNGGDEIVFDAPRGVLVRAANAQVPRDKEGNVVDNVVISGNWIIGDGGAPPSGLDIPTPPKKVKKILVNFNFGKGGNVEFKDFHLVGPNGRDGKDDMGESCNARGERGEDAFRMRVQAANIKINNFRLELGSGGAGGAAETKKDCDPGIARGGDGGEAGNFKMTALGQIEILSFHIVPGVGGQGGSATAQGKDGKPGCPGEKGGDARATGGDGGKNKKELAAEGAVSGIGNVTVDEVRGGGGGEATAKPGKGGDGTGCKCGGGKGGDATATGGKGGDASAKIVGGAAESHGGDGGDADGRGGNGGTGGACPLKPSGGNGGQGGSATSKEGKGGKGGTADGNPGNITDETGGDGGNGGDGCGPGKGGKGGKGKPPDKDGEPGKLVCPPDEKKGGGVTLPPGGSVTVPVPTPGSAGGGQPKKIKVIQYNGKYLPVDQLIIEDEAGCGVNHWHAAQGVVIATDGTPVPDPGPQCGYGKQSEKPAMDIDVPSEGSGKSQIEVRGLESIRQQ